jgi:hypothetical protein
MVSNLRFVNCRSWNNADDGFDFYFATPSTVSITNCWSFRNGLDINGNTLGNGNGFKLGGLPGYATGGIILRNCAAFANAQTGFDNNSGTVPDTLYNCTSWSNGWNYWLDLSSHLVRNCISYAGTNADGFSSTVNATYNSWTLPVTVTNADFVSLSWSGVANGPRQSDGNLPVITFLHLVTGSDLIDVGTNVGLSYVGSAPDLGAFEFGCSGCRMASQTTTITKATANPVEISVYPNPVSSVLQIRNAADVASFKILSLSGSVVKTGQVTNNGINVSNMLKGAYLIKVYDKNLKVLATSKFLKQ